MATNCRCFIFYFMMIALCPAVMHDDHARLVLVTESARRYPDAEATTLLSSQALAKWQWGCCHPKCSATSSAMDERSMQAGSSDVS
ncbi:hypothetical protein NL676_000628 [Syzygium grande]|nr:hypothetical protein NL676_000626 [Syzygium grande]KAI6672722.1 hypothetical protein NL676_000628 [Syzygium grande]